MIGKSHGALRRGLALLCALVLLLLSWPLGASAASQKGVVNTSKLVLRTSASKSSKALATLPQGENLTILGTEGDWYHVQYGKFNGYVMKKYVKLSSGTTAASTQTASASTFKLSSQTLAEMKKVGMPNPCKLGDENSDVKKLQQCLKLAGYYNTAVTGYFGTVTQQAVRKLQKALGLNQPGVADKTTINGLFGAKVSASTQTSSIPAASSTKSADTLAQLKAIGKPAACKLGDQNANVTKLQKCLKVLGHFSGEATGYFGTVTQQAVRAFQKKSGLQQTGIADTGTIAVMFGAKASSVRQSSTERLNWFSHTGTIPKGAVFTVKDCYTGKTFRCRRWSGANHMDSEPLTAADTAVMKSIYRSWAWTRRPILVYYNGHIYAASMNGMPHGTTTIADNNFDGHFCIHFYGSKTHGTKHVDEEHQRCESIAMNYSW